MRASYRTTLPLALLVLAACSPQQDGQAPGKPAADSPIAAANAEFARLQAQGTDATARGEAQKHRYSLEFKGVDAHDAMLIKAYVYQQIVDCPDTSA